jgi:hypothetical protein
MGNGIKISRGMVFFQSDSLQKLSAGYRFIFKLAGLFPVANRAH